MYTVNSKIFVDSLDQAYTKNKKDIDKTVGKDSQLVVKPEVQTDKKTVFESSKKSVKSDEGMMSGKIGSKIMGSKIALSSNQGISSVMGEIASVAKKR